MNALSDSEWCVASWCWVTSELRDTNSGRCPGEALQTLLSTGWSRSLPFCSLVVQLFLWLHKMLLHPFNQLPFCLSYLFSIYCLRPKRTLANPWCTRSFLRFFYVSLLYEIKKLFYNETWCQLKLRHWLWAQQALATLRTVAACYWTLAIREALY